MEIQLFPYLIFIHFILKSIRIPFISLEIKRILLLQTGPGISSVKQQLCLFLITFSVTVTEVQMNHMVGIFCL